MHLYYGIVTWQRITGFVFTVHVRMLPFVFHRLYAQALVTCNLRPCVADIHVEVRWNGHKSYSMKIYISAAWHNSENKQQLTHLTFYNLKYTHLLVHLSKQNDRSTYLLIAMVWCSYLSCELETRSTSNALKWLVASKVVKITHNSLKRTHGVEKVEKGAISTNNQRYKHNKRKKIYVGKVQSV